MDVVGKLAHRTAVDRNLGPGGATLRDRFDDMAIRQRLAMLAARVEAGQNPKGSYCCVQKNGTASNRSQFYLDTASGPISVRNVSNA